MRFTKSIAGALLLAATATPAFAQEETEAPDAFTITGSATVVSDYRFRGFSQTNEEATIQGGFTVAHESGLYVGTWGSGIGFNNGSEIDVFAGFAKEVTSGLTADVGVTAYFYPGAADTTIYEPYFSLTGTVGPATIKGGLAWAWGGQDSLGDDSAIYAYTDVAVGIPETPLKLKGHLGYAKSDSFLGGLDGEVLDYSIGAEVTWKALTLGVSYVNTDETTALGWKDAIGADGAVLFTLGASF
ncbi:TorF family putative porin [Sphingomonas sp.]|uniref:TorF family putative porin n=1 Tax=Sphingomonas sp. TaxID=28214 RepID=UPI00261BCE59|nr:TorF family putative porin [Sphingomonas sp.]MDK2770482.1 TorF family putative porin [Sphingomonas sp.]